MPTDVPSVASDPPAPPAPEHRGDPAPPPGAAAARAAAPFLAVAAAALVALVAVYAVALGTSAGHHVDHLSTTNLKAVRDPRPYHAISGLLHTVSIGSLAVFGGAIVLFAFMRRERAQALGALALLAGANLTTQALKPLLGLADPLGGEASRRLPGAFPSGHTTVAMSLGLALVLVAPVGLRNLAALVGAAYAIAVGLGVVAVGWHYPSDVAGAYLVSTVWALAVAGALRAWATRRLERPPAPRSLADPPIAVAVAGAVVALGLAVIALVRRADLIAYLHTDLVRYLRFPTLYFVAGAALAGLCLGLFLALAQLLRRYPDRSTAAG